MPMISFGDGMLRATVNTLGAELSSLVDSEGRELLWQGGAAWGRRAPVLFPIVGQVPGGELVHDGVAYPIGQHGFARDSEFTAVDVTDAAAAFELSDSPETLRHFPFRFGLRIEFSVADGRLGVLTTVTNTGDETFSASLGEHPGFAWPLVEGAPREAHTLEFEHDEPAGIRRISGGLVMAEHFATPVVGRVLPLRDDLFVDDAVIFDRLTSRVVRYSAPGAPTITVDFADFPLLGVWSKAPGEFVCIEPWFGMTAPVGFAGDYSQKPGQFVLEPGASRELVYGIGVTG